MQPTKYLGKHQLQGNTAKVLIKDGDDEDWCGSMAKMWTLKVGIVDSSSSMDGWDQHGKEVYDIPVSPMLALGQNCANHLFPIRGLSPYLRALLRAYR